MTMLDEGNVHLTTLDAGEVFIGGRYHSLIPLMQERLEGKYKYFAEIVCDFGSIVY
jgi:melanoma-associated antigen p97